MSGARKTALGALDDAIELMRSEPLSRLTLCAAPGLAMTWLALFVYYLERVEGVRSLRPVAALGLVLLWGLRSLLVGRFAGQLMQRLLRELDEPAAHGPGSSLLGAALVLGGELWLWLWLLVAAIRVEPWLSLAVLPLFALRGALAPCWLAACDALPETGPLGAAAYALRSATGQRFTGVLCELFLLLGAVALFFNVGGLTAAVVSLSQDLLGASLSFVRAFISPSNHFALIALGGCSLSAFEPLRAALSAVLWLESRDRREALHVQASVRRCIAQGTLLALLLSGLLTSADVHAQTSQDDVLMLPEGECDEACRKARARDDAVLVELVKLLDDDAFREFPDDSWANGSQGQRGLARWLAAFWGWLSNDPTSELEHAVRPAETRPPHARAALSLLIGVSACLVLVLLFSSLVRASRKPRSLAHDPTSASAPHGVHTHVADDESDLSRSLRGLYLASLAELARHGLLTLQPACSNGDYVRALPEGEARTTLAELTRHFERSQYGGQAPSTAQLQHAKLLARKLTAQCERP